MSELGTLVTVLAIAGVVAVLVFGRERVGDALRRAWARFRKA